jgi:hypothetical protein
MLLFIVLLPMLIGSLAGFVLGTRSRLMAAVAACAVTGLALALLLSMAPGIMAGQTVTNALALGARDASSSA